MKALHKQFRGLGLAGLAAFAMMPGIAHASVLWKGDFETGNLSQWSYKSTEKQMRVVATPVRQGKFAMEATAVNAGDRVEVQNGSVSSVPDSDKYYAWSLMAPKPLGPDDHQTGYFESKNTYHQIMAFVIKGTDVSLDTRLPNSQRRWTAKGKFTTGVWHDFVFHVKWSRDAAVGLIELWFDGQKAFDPIRLPTLWDANDAFFQIGFLSGQPGEILYVDEARVATALTDVMLAPPIMPDAGVPLGGSGGTAAGGAGGQTNMGTGGAKGSGGAGSNIGGTSGKSGGSGGSGGAEGGTAGADEVGGDGGNGGTENTPNVSEKKGGGCSWVAARHSSAFDLASVVVAALAAALARRRGSRS